MLTSRSFNLRRRVLLVAGLGSSALLFAACGGDAVGREPAAGSSPGAAFRAAVEQKDLDALLATFADDIRLYSPVFAEPFAGKPAMTVLFGVLVDALRDIEILDAYDSEGGYALSFRANVGGEQIHIVDLLRFDEEGKIDEFVVTARPLPGIQALAVAVAPHLAAINAAR